MLAVGRSTVYGLISGRALNSVRVGGSRRIPVHALQAYVAGLLPVQPPPATAERKQACRLPNAPNAD